MPVSVSRSSPWRLLAALPLLPIVSACASLPASGPTAGDIKSDARSDRNTLGFSIVEVSQPVLQQVLAEDSAIDSSRPVLASLVAEGRNDVVGPGDVLIINIYEVGVALFGAGRVGDSFDPSARGEAFPAIKVDAQGAITLPYVGRLVVAGKTTGEVESMINTALRGKSQNPQASVTVRLNVSSTVYVAGDVRRPGRFELSLQRERLLDAVALAGGAAYSSEDTVIRFTRGSQTIEERLGAIRSGTGDDIVLNPGDRIELIHRPRSFIVLGATSKVSQIPFETGDLSLAEAVARSGGPVDAVADPSAVFLFRYGSNDQVSGKPVIYRLNMMQPASYFLAQRFRIRDKDVIYIANAAANRPAKLVAIINQLFSPFVTARALAQ